jgi:hypothetical protein
MASIELIGANAHTSPQIGGACALGSWHPLLACQGSPWFVEVRHPLLGKKWSCLAHAIHLLEAVPDAKIVDGVGVSIADDIRARAKPRRC